MSTKQSTSKITSCKFTGEWENPSGGTTYYHELTLENGDIGSIGASTKNPAKLSVGVTITYKKDGSKIKYISSETEKSKPRYANTRKKGAEQYLGYAWSYAKDLHIAGKTMEDIAELNKMAEYIYQKIKDQLEE